MAACALAWGIDGTAFMRGPAARTASRRVRARVASSSIRAVDSSRVSRCSRAETRGAATVQPPATSAADGALASCGSSTRANQPTSSVAIPSSRIQAARWRRLRTSHTTPAATRTTSPAISHHSQAGGLVPAVCAAAAAVEELVGADDVGVGWTGATAAVVGVDAGWVWVVCRADEGADEGGRAVVVAGCAAEVVVRSRVGSGAGALVVGCDGSAGGAELVGRCAVGDGTETDGAETDTAALREGTLIEAVRVGDGRLPPLHAATSAPHPTSSTNHAAGPHARCRAAVGRLPRSGVGT